MHLLQMCAAHLVGTQVRGSGQPAIHGYLCGAQGWVSHIWLWAEESGPTPLLQMGN